MSKPKFLRVRSRLRAAVLDGGGMLVGQALAGAAANLEDLAEACDATLRDLLDRIEQDYGRGADRSSADPMVLYGLVLQMVDASSCSTMRGMPEACSSFCDLLDHCAATGRWDWPAVDVHIAALQCMGPGATLPEADRLKIVSGLVKLLKHRKPEPSGEAG